MVDRGTGDAFTAELVTDATSRTALAEKQARTMRALFEDTLGFAGCKMIRRILGLAHVADFESIADHLVRRAADAAARARSGGQPGAPCRYRRRGGGR